MSNIIRNLLTKFQRCPYQISRFCTSIETPTTNEIKSDIGIEPIISTRNYLNEEFLYQAKRQVWIENLDTIKSKKLGLMTLNPEVYADRPRVNVLFHNIRWQKLYRWVNYKHARTRAEMPGGGRKPWPQKGLGKARHGSIRSPLWKNGGRAHGPRSHAAHFYMPPFHVRVFGLTAALSVKLAQEDLYIVNDLEIPSRDPAYLEALIEERNWGPAVLFVDKEDVMPERITVASDEIDHVNLMPVYGLNVHSMLKHHTLVLTVSAAREIEDKILFQLNRPDIRCMMKKSNLSQV